MKKLGFGLMRMPLLDPNNDASVDIEQVKKMVYAMKRIDTGLSVCSIADIERGITRLRELFENGFDLSDSDENTKLFILMSEGIKKDYGKLVTSEAGFYDLIKWAYENGFYQPCLTLIESKAPLDIVSRGMFCYCNDESRKDHVTELFAKKRLQMRPSEYWKMNDVDHYFVKYYFYYKNPSDTEEHMRENAKNLLACIDNTDPNKMTGYTVCDDRKLLEDMLYAYLRIGTIRNETNHAEDSAEEEDIQTSEDTGGSSRYQEIAESVKYFIQSYEKVLANVSGKNPSVVRITGREVKAVARRMEKEEKSKNNK